MDVTVSNKMIISEAPPDFCRQVEERLTVKNPMFAENERMGRWNGKTPEYIRCFEWTNAGLEVPRGFTGQLVNLAKWADIDLRVRDRRRVLPEVGFDFGGDLRPYQRKAVGTMLARAFGTLAAPAGSGKTVMALAMIAKREQPTLIVVHTKELLGQWGERIESFLGIPASEVGIIGSGKCRIGEKITVALVQSLYKRAHEVAECFGHLVIDECHRAPSRTFTEAVSAFDSRFMLGLSATPWRRDKLSKLIFWYVGDVHHRIEQEQLTKTGDILRAEVVMRKTAFVPFSDAQTEYSAMLKELVEDPERNRLIVTDVAHEAQNGGGVCLVVSDRKTHCYALRRSLQDIGIDSEVLTGDLGDRERQRVVEDLNSGKVRVLIATGQLIGEGFDCKELSTLFCTTPMKFEGRVRQYLGRVLRPAPGKRGAKVYDYIDCRVPVLANSARSRARVFGAAHN